jgi:hypothetical protein
MMNTQTKKALEMAIEALEGTPEGYSEFRALQACKEALAQPQPKLFLAMAIILFSKNLWGLFTTCKMVM